MKHTDQTLTNNFTAGDMADQAASGFREGLSKAIELAKIYGHISLAAHLEHIHDNPDTAYIEGNTYIDEYLNENEDKADYRIQGIWFKLTCGACPEQYDVFAGTNQVAYVRLRWGRLRVDVPDVGGETVYVNYFDDEFKGTFSNEQERVHYLNEIVTVLNEYYRNK